MTKSSAFSTPLLLIVFVALAVPLIARAVTEADVLPGAKYCPWYKGFWCQDANRANGFTGDGTMTLAQYQARNSASSPVTRAPAPAPSSALPVGEAIQQYRAGERASYNSNPLPPAEAIQQYRAGERASYNNNPLPTGEAFQQYRAGERALYNTAPGATAPASTEPDPSVWVKDSTGAYFLKSDLKSSAPATKTLTPLEKYQAQFNVDAEFNRIATSCGNDDLGMGQERCMNYMIGLYRGGNPLSSDALKVQTYINSQSSAPQPITGASQTVQQKLDACNAWTDEYGNETQNSTLCKNGVLDAARDSGEPAQTPSIDQFSGAGRNLQADFDTCDTAFGVGTSASNKCKEPLLQEMQNNTPTWTTTYDPTSPQTSEDFYNQLRQNAANATFETRPAVSTVQPCARRAGNGDCLDEPTGGLRCYSWIASWLPACENYKAASTFVADEKGGVTYQQFPAPVEERQAPTPRPYTREEENALSRITVTAEDTRFTPDETAPGPATGWLKDTQDFFASFFGGGADSSSAPYVPSYVGPNSRSIDGRASSVLVEEMGGGEWDFTGDTAQTAPLNNFYGEQEGTRLPDSVVDDTANYAPTPPLLPFYDMSKGNDPEQVTGLSSEWLQEISNHCVNDPYFQGCVLNNIDSVKATGELIPSFQPDVPLPGMYQGNTGAGESFIKDASFVPDNSDGSAEDTGWSLWNPGSWPIFETWGTEASIKPPRQFSMAVPFSDTLFNQSLAASAFGAFLLKSK